MAYCIDCGCKTTYTMDSSVEEHNVRGVSFFATERVARCVKCGSAVYVPWVNDVNVKVREAEYHKAKSQLTKDEFIAKFCTCCGSQRCEGVGTEWFDGCTHKSELRK